MHHIELHILLFLLQVTAKFKLCALYQVHAPLGLVLSSFAP